MSYVIKLTYNGKLTINGSQCRIAKDKLDAAIGELKTRVANQNVLGLLRHDGSHEEKSYTGFSHKVTSAYASNGELYAVIDPLNTPEGHELDQIMKQCRGVAENSAKYEFAPSGFMDRENIFLTSVDILKK